ncbi:hypothetical protein [Desulfotignum balticum]|uniref:hypothetical protein n=1 Tax=Desulfotignum balticum TaxID=115781 RepID=UPI0012EBF696|nr:hypothetical protein [Desulfotignum balticum]
MIKSVSFFWMAWIILLAGVLTFPCQADDLSRVDQQFDQFVQNWVKKLQTAYLYTRETPEVIEKEGQYVARYFYLDPGSMKTDVKPVSGESNVYTGVLEYKEILFQSTGQTPHLAETGAYAPKCVRQMIEIFLYDKGSWVR